MLFSEILCISCEKVLDAHYNASIKIRNRGENAEMYKYSPSNQEIHYFS